MADKKITQLPASTVPLVGTEVLPIVQSGTTKQVSVANLTAGRAISATEATLTTGNLVIGTSGKGIDFSATADGSGTMTSELLSDYEEGTWTGTIKGSISDPTTPVTATGQYTKVGRQVTIQIYFINADTTGGSGDLSIDGLPYTPTGTPNNQWVGSCASQNLSVPNKYNAPAAFGSLNMIYIYTMTDNGVWAYTTLTAGTGKFLIVTLTYFV